MIHSCNCRKLTKDEFSALTHIDKIIVAMTELCQRTVVFDTNSVAAAIEEMMELSPQEIKKTHSICLSLVRRFMSNACDERKWKGLLSECSVSGAIVRTNKEGVYRFVAPLILAYDDEYGAWYVAVGTKVIARRPPFKAMYVTEQGRRLMDTVKQNTRLKSKDGRTKHDRTDGENPVRKRSSKRSRNTGK